MGDLCAVRSRCIIGKPGVALWWGGRPFYFLGSFFGSEILKLVGGLLKFGFSLDHAIIECEIFSDDCTDGEVVGAFWFALASAV